MIACTCSAASHTSGPHKAVIRPKHPSKEPVTHCAVSWRVCSWSAPFDKHFRARTMAFSSWPVAELAADFPGSPVVSATGTPPAGSCCLQAATFNRSLAADWHPAAPDEYSENWFWWRSSNSCSSASVNDSSRYVSAAASCALSDSAPHASRTTQSHACEVAYTCMRTISEKHGWLNRPNKAFTLQLLQDFRQVLLHALLWTCCQCQLVDLVVRRFA